MTTTISVAAPFTLNLRDDGDFAGLDTSRAAVEGGGYDNVVGPIHTIAFPAGTWNVPDAVAAHWYLLKHATVIAYNPAAPVPPGLSSISFPR
ncbi:hypothetical protein [Methylosinus sp. Ce-a6]|uniref:hypothetical protein n=1 Tax=Methylosinus sp. Ce-a6 TaxID=2172005 RepID=UPI00135C4233|nr:hypothetical protein [Methylosinus sp. Ce-a6]